MEQFAIGNPVTGALLCSLLMLINSGLLIRIVSQNMILTERSYLSIVVYVAIGAGCATLGADSLPAFVLSFLLISSFGLSQDLSISRKEAQLYIEKYFETYPGVKKFLDDQVAHAKENGFVRTFFGRIRPIPELSSSNFMQRSFGERVAMNSPIQGTAADIMKIAMNRVNMALSGLTPEGERIREPMRSHIVLQVHDELLIETAPEELAEVKAMVKKLMEEAAELSVKLAVDVQSGDNWYDCH